MNTSLTINIVIWEETHHLTLEEEIEVIKMDLLIMRLFTKAWFQEILTIIIQIMEDGDGMLTAKGSILVKSSQIACISVDYIG